MAEGKSLSSELKTLFEKAANFILRVYKTLEKMFVKKLNPELKEVFDKMPSKEDSQLTTAEKLISSNLFF